MPIKKTFFGKYISRTSYPYWLILIIDLFIVLCSGIWSVYLVHGGTAVVDDFWLVVRAVLYSLPAYLIGMHVYHTYYGVIRYSGYADLLRLVKALALGTAIVFVVTRAMRLCGMTLPFPYIFYELLVTWLLASFFQIGLRVVVKQIFDNTSLAKDVENVFIYGIREGGITLAKSMMGEHPRRYTPVGFVTTDKNFHYRRLLGNQVYPVDGSLIATMIMKNVKTLFVSPNCSEQFRENDELVGQLTRAGFRIMMMPTATVWDGKSDISHLQLREVEIEDLLPRDKVEVDLVKIGEMLKGRSILVTGAAGSIGSEIARQVATFAPSNLILVDQAETPMHDMRLFMSRHHKDLMVETIVGNITNKDHMEKIFRDYRPEYVFHAAAYKHVPMMEDNPAMAVQNNIFGTRVIADLSVRYGVHKFVMVSTDKAVNPTNVMGCSKRICEIYCQALNKAIKEGTAPSSLGFSPSINGPCQFITTRFGNVLGSNGSVIPIFREQIKNGGPITVTHKDIIRYFMLIPEACQLVLAAGTMGNGGEIYVFDMGKPVRIADLAQRMIDLSGATNVKIVFTGLRDGEKLYEEVLNDKEETQPTTHPKIKVAKVREYPYELAVKNEEELYELSFKFNDFDIVDKMKEIVPEYISQHSKYESLDHKVETA